MTQEEAAAEIKQLRAALLASDAEIHRLNTDIVKRARKAVEAADEIERLRALDGEALRHAQRLATILWEKHWKSDNPHWKVGDNLLLVIDQIDNAVAKLEKP